MRAILDSRWHHKETGEFVILDNRDSFVFNLAHRLWECGVRKIAVVRSDTICVGELESWKPSALIVSPGPGHPDEAGISVEAIKTFSGRIPILGVCLGHQAIGVAFGATVSANGAPCHGKATFARHENDVLHEELESPFEIGRYHSLVVEKPVKPPLVETAWSDGFVMGIRHVEHPTYGVQYHPESVLTVAGRDVLANFARLVSPGFSVENS